MATATKQQTAPLVFTEDEQKWLNAITGLAAVKDQREKERGQKELLKKDMDSKLMHMKESIRDKMTIKLKKKYVGSIKTLEEEGGQLDEFDLSDFESIKEFKFEYTVMMSQALNDVEVFAKQMREATTDEIDPETGAPVIDPNTCTGLIESPPGSGNMIPDLSTGTPKQVALFTEAEIADELYMPLVRERLIPEYVVPNKYSKTQEMIDASDQLYRERLAEYTQQTTDDGQGLLESGKSFVTTMGNVAQKVAAMIPVEEAATAEALIGLVTLGTTTIMTGAQVLTKRQLDDTANVLIDNIGSLMEATITFAVDDNVGKSAGMAYKGAVTGGQRVAVHLFKSPEPAFDKALEELGTGFEASLSLCFTHTDVDPTLAGNFPGAIKTLFMSLAGGVRAKQHLENHDVDGFLMEMSKVAQGVLKEADKIGREIIAAKETGQVSLDMQARSEEVTRRLSEGIELMTAAVITGKMAYKAVKTKQLELMAEDLVAAFGGILTGAFKSALPPEKAKIADQIGAAYSMSTSAGLVAMYMTREPQQPGKALQKLGEGFGKAMELADPGNKELRKAGDLIGKALEGSGTALLAKKAFEEENYGEAVKGLSSIGQSLIKSALDGKPAENATIGQEALSEFGGIVANFKDKCNSMENEAELEKKLAAMRTENALNDLESSRRDLDALFVQVDEGGEAAADNRAIEKLIHEMVRDRMILEMAAKLMAGGASVVGKFVPTLGVGPAIQLTVNLTKAAERGMALNKWVSMQKDMHRAVSSFESSAQNFVTNQAAQFSHYTIQAALDLAKMIGEILEFAGAAGFGIGVVVGEAISKSAALAAAAEEASWKFYKEVDLALAWRATQKAWKHPESRKLQLVARKMNPTLAKYTLAWGAAVKKDAMAKQACAICGLNELTLSQRDSNVNMVQKYLEVSFPDDNVVLKRVEITPDWLPGTLELTPKCWTVAKSRATRYAEPKLVEEPTGIIDGSLSAVPPAKALYEEALKNFNNDANLEDELEQAKKNYVAKLEAAAASFYKYKPVDEKGLLHEEVYDLMKTFRQAAEATAAQVDLEFVEAVSLNLDMLFPEEK